MGDIVSGVTDFFSGGEEPDYGKMEFTPYSVSSNLGGVSFDRGSKEADISLSPELKAFYDQYLKGAGLTLPTGADADFANQMTDYGKGLFGSASTALTRAMGTDVNQQASDYYNQQLGMLERGRAQEEARLKDTLFSTGRTGYAQGVAGGGYMNPEQFALFKAREEANAGLAMNSLDRARAMRTQDIQEALNLTQAGTGYYGMGKSLPATAYGTSANILGYGTGLTSSLNPYLAYGIQAGSASANAGANIVSAQNTERGQNLSFWGGLLGGSSYSQNGGWSYGGKS